MAQVVNAPDVARTPPPAAEAKAVRRVRPINVNTGLLLMRAVVGVLFVGHGTQKLFGWFGGPGMQAWTESIARNGLQPAPVWASVSALAEVGSGVLLALGLLTPIAAALLIGDMLVAVLEVHVAKGLWSQNGGFEYNLVLIVLLVCIGLIGPGMYSLDRRLPKLPRPYTFVAALGVTLLVAGIAVVPRYLGAA